jgi:hypothetical protein
VTKDDILQAMRLTAMGVAGHPLQERLAEELAAVLATPEQRADAEMAEAGIPKRARKAKAD